MATRRTMTEQHRNYLLNRARRTVNRKRNNSLNFSSLRDELNNAYSTNYSIYQVSATLGNAGFRQTT